MKHFAILSISTCPVKSSNVEFTDKGFKRNIGLYSGKNAMLNKLHKVTAVG